jgi:hypothetical protein
MQRLQQPCRNFLGNQPVYPVAISPSDIAKLIIESFEDIAEPIQLWLGLESTAFCRHWLYF